MRRLIVPLLVFAASLCALCASASAARLYTPSYYAEPQAVGGFEQQSDGSLVPLAGSPFPIVPGPPFATSGIGNMAFAPEGSRAAVSFYFDGGVLGLGVDPGGTVAPAQAPVVGPDAFGLAISPDGRFAYAGVADPASPVKGVLGFSLGPAGALAALGSSPFGSGVYSDLAMSPDGRFLFAVAAGEVQSFAVASDGSLAPPGSTAVPGAQTLGVSPDGRFLFVGVKTPDGVASFSIGADGSLTQNGAPALTGDVSLDFFTVAPDGSHVYMPDSNLDGIVTAAIAADGKPTVVNTMPTDNPQSVAVSPDGRFLYWYKDGSENGLRVAALGADGIPTELPFATPWDSGETERILFQPQPTPVAGFKAKTAAPGAEASFNAAKSERAARFDWDFGDGSTLADGGPNPKHVYAGPGAYTVTLTVTDANGCSARQVYTGQSTTCPGGSAARTTAVLDTLPVISGLKVSPKRFAPAGPAPRGGKASVTAKRSKGGAWFRYRLSEPARVRFKIERRLPGRKVGKKCKRATPGNSKRKPCPLFRTVGSRSASGKAGANRYRFAGRLRGNDLAPGPYRVTAIATDKAGGRSAPARAAFRIRG